MSTATTQFELAAMNYSGNGDSATLGFTPQQHAGLMEQDVTVDQLRGRL